MLRSPQRMLVQSSLVTEGSWLAHAKVHLIVLIARRLRSISWLLQWIHMVTLGGWIRSQTLASWPREQNGIIIFKISREGTKSNILPKRKIDQWYFTDHNKVVSWIAYALLLFVLKHQSLMRFYFYQDDWWWIHIYPTLKLQLYYQGNILNEDSQHSFGQITNLASCLLAVFFK